MEPAPDSASVADAVTPYVTEPVTAQENAKKSLASRRANVGTDWEAIRLEWQRGVTSAVLASQFKVSASAIRMRAQRFGWDKGLESAIKKGASISVKRIVSKRVKEMSPEIKRRADMAIAECVTASITGAKSLVTKATDSIQGASPRDLSSVATSLRTGVTVWREALGLGSAGEGNGGLTINAHSVQLAVEERFAEPDPSPVVDV